MTTAQLPASFLAKTAQDPARRVNGAPANLGREVTPHIFSVSGRTSDPGHTYPWADEALRDNRENAEMMRTECGIMECLESRQRGTALLRWHVEPQNSKDFAAKDLAKKVTDILQATWQFLELRRNLLEALWFGRYLTSHRFGVINIEGHSRQYIRKWTPRNGDKLVFRYDDGSGEYSDDQIGIRISRGYHSSETDWRGMSNRKVQATQHGLVRWLDDWERQMVAVHRHMIEDSSFYGSRDVGRVNGVGIRDRIYWTWYAMQDCLGNLMTFIERSAYGIEIWKFPAGNPIAERRTMEAAKNRSHRSIILVPVQPGELADLQTVEIVEPGMNGAQVAVDLVFTHFSHKIKRYILGQTLTSEAAGTGLGSGVADAHMGTYADIILYDATKLQETATTDIVRSVQLFNFPDSADIRLLFRIDTQAEDMDQKLEAWERAYNMGAELPVTDVLAMIGARKADNDEEKLKNPQFSQAAQQAMQQQAADPNAGGPWKPSTTKVFPPLGDKGNGIPRDGIKAKGGDGEALQEKYAATAEEIEAAARKTATPTDAQREAGNYRKGKISLHGLEISIETPKGESRKPEYPPLAAHYGYIRSTQGKDGDHVDVFVGPHPKSELVVVIDQETEAGRFDEHKIMLGYTNMADAVECYRDCYGPDWRVGPVTTMTVDQFKAWLEHGDQTQRVDGQVSRYAADGDDEFRLSNKPKRSGPALDNRSGRQQALFGKSGSPGQMNMFDDVGVPDDLLPKGERRKPAAKDSDEGHLKWITIGGAPGSHGKHEGGTHVKIDTRTGDIVDGPKELADQGIKNLKDFGGKDDDSKQQASDKRADEPSAPDSTEGMEVGAKSNRSGKGKESQPENLDESTDTPDAGNSKSPWQLTRGEWHAANRGESDYDVAATNRQHKQSVADAIRSGEDVPPDSYVDYPDLAEMARAKREQPEAASQNEFDQSPDDDLVESSTEPDPWGSPGDPVQDTPRDEAAVATEQSLSDESEYAFARQSSITNVGEDVLGSARHKVNAWRGLQDAEQNGTAAEMVTRDQLLKNEPHALMAHVAKNPLTALAMHHAIRAFPSKPGYGTRYKPDDETAKKDRGQYVDAYQRVKAEAERLAETESDPIKAMATLQEHVSKLLREYRGQKSNSIGPPSDPYNSTANSLVGLTKQLGTYRPKSNSVIAQTAKFAAAFKAKYEQELSSTDKLDKVTKHASDVIEGKSINDAFGVNGEGGSRSTITPADLYVNVAERKGGKDLADKTPTKLADMVTGEMRMRAIQWGNSVSDDERKHHLTKATEALVDLADVVGLPMSAISGEGTLALAIGARGHGRALAHYEPGKKIINLTRKNGVGSLAHEWGHFFDHWIGGLETSKEGGRYQSNQIAKQWPIEDEKGNWKKDEKGKVVYKDLSQDPMWKSFDDVRKSWKDSGYRERLDSSLNKLVSEGRLKRGTGGGTSFGMTGYWTSNQEMFARSFERYTQHKLRSEGRDNTYLSGFDTTKDEDGLWPTDDEVAKMAPAFDKLFETVRKEKYGHLGDSTVQFENDFARSFNDAYRKATGGDQPPATGYGLPPKKSGKEPADPFHKAVVAAVGDKPEDVIGFKNLALEIWDRKRKEAEDNNHALRNLLSQFGVDGKRQGAFIQQVRRAEDPDQIPKFDQMVEMATRDYPGLLEYDQGESAGKDDAETALFNRLHRGLQDVPAKHSDEVIQEALDYVQAAHRATASIGKQYEDWSSVPFARKSNEWWSLVKYAASQWRSRIDDGARS